MNSIRFRSGRIAVALLLLSGLSLSACAKSGEDDASAPQKAVASKALPSALAEAPPAAMKPDAAIESAILRTAPDYTREIVGDERARYAYERVDLNGDGREELLVYLMGSFFCGSGGCSMLILREAPEGGYLLVNDYSITQLPVIVSPGKSNGWNDIWRMESGGGAEASYVRHSFDGRRYAKKERIGASKAPEGKPCLAGEVTYEKGMVLEPRN